MTKQEQQLMHSYIKEHPDEIKEWILEEVTKNIKEIHKFQSAHRKIVEEYIDYGLLPAYSDGFISVDKQFCTIGLNGVLDACQFLGLDIETANDEYINFVADLMAEIKKLNKEGNKLYGNKFNTEIVPSENLAVKNAQWDKKGGLEIYRNCYSSYFYDPASTKTSIIDKLKMHGGKIADSCDGGQQNVA